MDGVAEEPLGQPRLRWIPHLRPVGPDGSTLRRGLQPKVITRSRFCFPGMKRFLSNQMNLTKLTESPMPE